MSGFDFSGFLASFFDEANERLALINQSLVLFEAGDLDDDGLLLLRRYAHTIKGSALMLGVRDVSSVSHLFEDVMEYLIAHPEARSTAMVQFLFDLHDQLGERLACRDTKPRLDIQLLQQKYRQLRREFDRDRTTDAKKSPVIARARRVSKPARSNINKKLIASVMGSIKDSMDDKPGEAAEPKPANVRERRANKGKDRDEKNRFRPDVSMLEMKAPENTETSGRFLRVDNERLTCLSNQIIELSSDRKRDERIEKQFHEILDDLQQIKLKWQVFEASDQGRWDSAKRTRVAGKMKNDFDFQLRRAMHFGEELRQHQRHASIMLDDLRDQVLGLMLRPLSTVFSAFPRTVRDIAKRSGKKVQLLVAGESVEMDQAVADALVEALVHLLNNAVAHGIEPPDERVLVGKPEVGRITILARQYCGGIRIEVIDDGRGLDAEKIRRKAIEGGIISSAEADEMDLAEIFELIFQPCLSTQQEVNDVSGRGMGMNIVQNAVRKLTGTIHIHTQPGQGARFVLTLPVSIAIQKALTFRIARQRFGMLVNMVEKILPLQPRDIEKGSGIHGKGFIFYEHHHIPIVDLRSTLSEPGKVEPSKSEASIIIVEHIDGYTGIVVDELYGETEVIVRDLDPYLKQYQLNGLIGATIADDGSVLILIEPNGIREMWRTSPNIALTKQQIEAGRRLFDHRILLVDDSMVARNVERTLLESIGCEVDTAIDGEQALEKIRRYHYDLLVSDLNMPRLNGFDLISEIRKEHLFTDMPILVIAISETAEDQQRALDAGANAYLMKQQLSGDQILSTLQSLLATLTSEDNKSTNRPPENQAPIV